MERGRATRKRNKQSNDRQQTLSAKQHAPLLLGQLCRPNLGSQSLPPTAMSLQQALHQLEIVTTGEGFTDLTAQLNHWIASSRINRGVLHLTALHTSCSLTINENADPRVLTDLSAYLKALVPEEGFRPINGLGERRSYLHDDEGPDDMPAHIRTALTCSTLSLSIDQGRLLLGIWQAIYLWEHRRHGSHRRVAIHAIGEMNSHE
ncbi:secondary thiamine-phosphate synthase enzyme YjbQ [Prochlorococcus marinus]|uniref:secondary thiamine-phosphate synthase enzyme YjbQ n=1 Tax=Prochlorococcus marinus TaxID=1219 RepID=UPI0007BB1471|nr:secondary thiamine-phosphate synthase enzyme YjbQ [Prochlorococcus marinus]KZR74893.1 hypothetical protein PMIT1320_01519 [Prochlorococcus marinus str. MIT 1320]